MEDQLISFETAKLAREKGFNNGSYALYTYPNKELKHFQAENYNSEQDDLQFEAPTQSLLQKWLREKHQLHITIYSCSQESWMFNITKPGQYLPDGIYGEDFEDYEEALEDALQEALKSI